MKQKQTR